MESPDADLIDINVRLPRALVVIRHHAVGSAKRRSGAPQGLAFAKWILGSRRRRSKAFKSVRFG